MVTSIKIYGQSDTEYTLKYVECANDYRKQSSLYLTNVTYYDIIRIRLKENEASRVHHNRLMMERIGE